MKMLGPSQYRRKKTMTERERYQVALARVVRDRCLDTRTPTEEELAEARAVALEMVWKWGLKGSGDL